MVTEQDSVPKGARPRRAARPSGLKRFLETDVDSSSILLVRALWGLMLCFYIIHVMYSSHHLFLYYNNYIHNSELLHHNASFVPSVEPQEGGHWMNDVYNPFKYPGGIIESIDGVAVREGEDLQDYRDSNSVYEHINDHGLQQTIPHQVWNPMALYAPYVAPFMDKNFSAFFLATARSPLHSPGLAEQICGNLLNLAVVVAFGGGLVPFSLTRWLSISRAALVALTLSFFYIYTWADSSLIEEPFSVGGPSDLHHFVIIFSAGLCLVPSLSDEFGVNVGQVIMRVLRRMLKRQHPIPSRESQLTPLWSLWLLRVLMITVYLFSALSKVNYDWVIRAEPLRHWLLMDYLHPDAYYPFFKTGVPEVFVELLRSKAFAIGLARSHVLAELAFALLLPLTSGGAFHLVLGLCWTYHLVNYVLFSSVLSFLPIALAIGSLVFCDPGEPRQVLAFLFAPASPSVAQEPHRGGALRSFVKAIQQTGVVVVICIFVTYCCFMPLRPHVLSSDACWTSDGLAFSWGSYTCDKWCTGDFEVHQKDSEDEYTDFSIDFTSFRADDEYRVPYLLGNPRHLVNFAMFYRHTFHVPVNDRKKIFISADVKCSTNYAPLQQFSNPSENLVHLHMYKASSVVVGNEQRKSMSDMVQELFGL